MTNIKSNKIPSLLDREATGGEFSERGLTFQETVLIEHIPRWLSEEGFTALIRESLSDIEVQFFIPGIGYQKEFIEAKQNLVAPAEFKRELRRFQEMGAASAGTFRWFTLACHGLSEALKPLANGLRHVRDPFAFYAKDALVQDASYADFEKIVQELDSDYTPEDARFLFERVQIKSEYGHAISGEGMFRQGLLENLPEYSELSQRLVTTVFDAVSHLVKSRLRVLITRREIETTMLAILPEQLRPAPSPIQVWTLSEPDNGGPGFRFPWERFFGGGTRQYPNSADWELGMIAPLLETRRWIEQNRQTRRICLEGSRRLSASIALGATLPAVSGFVIEMNHRGETWATDAHSLEEIDHSLTIDPPVGEGDDLVVALSIIRPIRHEVEQSLTALQLSDAPMLVLHAAQPVTSPTGANNLVAKVKAEIHRALIASKSHKIHLFYAGPSHIALFLGHRLNATGSVQCYEWIGLGAYVPTCLLR